MGKSAYAERINACDVILSGLKKNEKELALPVKIAGFAKLLADAKAEDKVQEELKAKTQESTVRLNKLMKDLKDDSARIISSLQGQYGKKNEKLEEFGIKPLKSGRRKPAAKQQ